MLAHLTAVYWLREALVETAVVIIVEMAEEVGLAARDSAVAERIHCKRCSCNGGIIDIRNKSQNTSVGNPS